MPRARNIKPAFFKNEILIELSFETRLLFIGLWTLADREGRLEDRPKRIKMEIFPADNLDVNSLLNQLQNSGFIQRYRPALCESGASPVLDNNQYIQIINFTKHQNPHVKEAASIIPALCESGASPADSFLLIPDSPLLKPDILNPECGLQNTQNFKDLILEGEFLKVANEASLHGESGINCWKKWKATRENNPPDDVMGNWKVWVLNERVAERPQSEEKLQGADLQMQNLGAINWKRKAATRNSSFKPSHGELTAIHEWESANGNVWWDNLEQYKTGKPL